MNRPLLSHKAVAALAIVSCLALSARSRAEAPASKPQVWAMLVGIERYEDAAAFPRCRGAAEDAAAMARWLIQTAGWPADHVLLLSDREAADLGFADPAAAPERRPATKAQLDRGVKEWLGGKVKPGDVVLIAFAGHAVGLPQRPGDHATRSARDVLIPWDARGVDVEATGWRIGDAIEGLAARGDVSIVCLLDTSPAGRVQSPRPLGSPAKFEPGARMLRGIVRWPGVTAWLAASERPSGQDAKDGAGLLTRALLESLGGRKDPANLAAALERLRRKPELASQGFRASGGFRPDLSLWPSDVRPVRPKSEPILQRGHGDRVTAIEFSGHGSRLFTAGMDSTVRIWDAADVTLGRVLPHAFNGAWSLARSEDGRLIAAGGGKGEVFAFDLVSEEPLLADRSAHRGPVDRIAFLPTAAEGDAPPPRRLVSVDDKGACLTWEVAGRRLRPIASPADGDSRFLAVATRPGPVAFAVVAPDRSGADRLAAFDSTGKVVARLPIDGSAPSALALADDGATAYLAREDGTIAEVSLPGGENRDRAKLEAPARWLRPSPTALLAAEGANLWALPNAGGPPTGMALDREVGRAAVSADGRLVAACDRFRGGLRAWELSPDAGQARPITIETAGGAAVLSLAFSPGGDTLAAGDGLGGVRLWDIPAGRARAGIAPGAGRARHVAVWTEPEEPRPAAAPADAPEEPSGGRRALLQVGEGGEALVWEFGEGRGARRVPGDGYQAAGAFLPNGDIALIDADGRVVVHDRENLARRPEIKFDQPSREDGAGPSGWGFHRLAVAEDGRIAAASPDGPLACVWTPDGRLACAPIRGHDDRINAVAFGPGGRELLTGSDDGLLKVWDVSAAEPRLLRTLAPSDPAGRAPVTAAAASPTVAGESIAGLQDGRFLLWRAGAADPVEATARLTGEVRAVAYSPDGKLAVAAGDDRRIALIEAARPGLPIRLGDGPGHTEQVNSLAFWPDGKVLASAGDDAAVRLWRMSDRAAIGVLSAVADGLDWVVYTPEGLYDASPSGERRVAWRPDPKLGDGEFVARLDQVRKQRHVFDLAERLARAEDVALAAIPAGKPPRIELGPVAEFDPKRRRVDLEVRLDDPEVDEVRLYQNGIPIPGDLKREGSGYRATVTLVGGENSLYALATKPGTIDARSNRLDLHFEGQTLGRTHVLALGVSKYARQALRYADVDARAMADFLKASPEDPGAVEAEPILLLNEDASQRTVSEAFEVLRRRVVGRPEDRIVVFIAGHTDVRDGFFCLLLPTARLPEGPDVVAMRGPDPKPGPAAPRGDAPLRDRTLLPYGMIHRSLATADALQRLVIVDACQAEALFDDPVVRSKRRRSVRTLAEEDAYQARTSYILASRRGERAGEAEPLKHGLLTYTLLRGMGGVGMGPDPDLAVFKSFPTADLNSDGWVETDELRRYSDVALPSLAREFPDLVLRGAPSAAGAAARAVARDVQQADSFPLVELRGPVPVP